MNTSSKLRRGTLLLFALFGWVAASQNSLAEATSHTFAIGEDDFLLDGKPLQIRCGEIHAPRVPREYWQHRLRMAHAMGLNTVCAYLFWNFHEPRPGEFVWTGQADTAEFCRLAQQEGLWVILRPGPYSCAEWEMGGLPWWLLKEQDFQPRTRAPGFLDPARQYLQEVGRVLGPLQITRGGPILMVQVENEYGFFGKDADYMGDLRQALLNAGFDVPLFACNPTQHLKDGWRPDLFPVVNFGSDPAGSFKSLREILPRGPLMCGEFYPGWFDTWGAPHHTGNTHRYLTDLEFMLKSGASFSIYMVHGGTTFGLWSGADRPFKPDTSSYDYDAPISEAGWTTEKFFKTRELFAKYLRPGETIPEPPAKNPMSSFAQMPAYEFAPLFDNLSDPVKDSRPRTMESYDQGHGCIVYRTTLAPGPSTVLDCGEVHDLGLVYLDGQRIGFLDRRSHAYKLSLPEHPSPARLDILVEPMGRVNFGAEVQDSKGLHGPVRLISSQKQSIEPADWQIYRMPLDAKMLEGLRYTTVSGGGVANRPGFWRASMQLEKPADTFLDVRSWGKGVVWINGRCLGRFWNIGPTQTMYVPGPWLKSGRNEIVVLDLLGPEKPMLAGLQEPILNQLRPELDFMRAHRPAVSLSLNSVTPMHLGQFAAGSEMQEVKFEAPVRGRYFCIESRSAHDGKPYAAIAELDLLDQSGKPLSHEGWTVAYVDSEERDREDGTAENAIDGQVANFWHTQWGGASPNHPHRLVLDLGQTRSLSGFRYVPRQGTGSVGGRIKDYCIYVSDHLVEK
jgi:beta-galactosidase